LQSRPSAAYPFSIFVASSHFCQHCLHSGGFISLTSILFIYCLHSHCLRGPCH
jgi:hypothetical protein